MRKTAAMFLPLLALGGLGCAAGDDTDPDDASGTALDGPDDGMAGGSSGAEGEIPTTGTDDAASDGGDVAACPCGPPGTLLRATIEQAEQGEVSLRVQERLHGELALGAGDTLQARYQGRLPCYRGTLQVQAGDEVLALLREGDRLADGRFVDARLSPWQDPLLFARTDEDELTVPQDELASLWGETAACVERFGNWDALQGPSTDGDSNAYYCVDEDSGRELLCANPTDELCAEDRRAAATECASDADCEDGLVCHGQPETTCPDDVDTACMQGESDTECAERAERLLAERCERMEVSRCTPRWQLECETDDDCGEGFVCSTSGCHLMAIDCEGADDCPDGWSCRALDGGHCDPDDPDCVDGQLELRNCAPPTLSVGCDDDSTR
ncbi:MAG: hypothetical protein PVI30_13920 [Myxococcales bacterium]|jgi:hypothetical protein